MVTIVKTFLPDEDPKVEAKKDEKAEKEVAEPASPPKLPKLADQKWPDVRGQKSKPLLVNTSWAFSVTTSLLVPVFMAADESAATTVFVDQINKLFVFQMHRYENGSNGDADDDQVGGDDKGEDKERKQKKKRHFRHLDYVQSWSGKKIGWCLVVPFHQLLQLCVSDSKVTFYLRKSSLGLVGRSLKGGKLLRRPPKLARSASGRETFQRTNSAKLPGNRSHKKTQRKLKPFYPVNRWLEHLGTQFNVIDAQGEFTTFLVGRQEYLPLGNTMESTNFELAAVSRLIEAANIEYPNVLCNMVSDFQAGWAKMAPKYVKEITDNYYYYLDCVRAQLRASGHTFLEVNSMNECDVVDVWMKQRQPKPIKRRNTEGRVLDSLRHTIRRVHQFFEPSH